MTARDLPIHFFTIVLNGEPFIRYHENVFARLKHDWHWHIVEGVAALKHDTAWSVAAGGRVVDSLHERGRSNDGTTAYLDELAERFPDRVTIYRKPVDEFWDGKREMVGAPLLNIRDECLLWQVDADELWRPEQIDTVHAMFSREPNRTAAFYWCWYFVGPRKIISTRYNYAQNPDQEWLRTWRYRPGDSWFAHEPPTLSRGFRGSEPIDLAKVHPFKHDEMEREGVVFQHFAYVLESQLAFKEIYYGYKDARRQWRSLQEQKTSGLLRDFLKWVPDETIFDEVDLYGVDLIATEDRSGNWLFHVPPTRATSEHVASRRILVDGVIWQSEQSPIRRFWTSLLYEWVRTGFSENVIIVDRAGTAPRINGIHYWTIGRFDADRAGHASFDIEAACRSLQAQLFVSTGYSAPIEVLSCVANFDEDQSTEAVRRERIHAGLHATGRILLETGKLAEEETDASVRTEVIPLAVSASSIDANRVREFRRENGLDTRPYVVLSRSAARNLTSTKSTFSEEEFTFVTARLSPSNDSADDEPRSQIGSRSLAVTDESWLTALAGAYAFICTDLSTATSSLAALEAMGCDCPVIMCGDSNSSLLEAPLFVDQNGGHSLIAALKRLRDPAFRRDKIDRGRREIQRFPMRETAVTLASAILDLLAYSALDAKSRLDRRGWFALRELQKAIESRDAPISPTHEWPIEVPAEQSRAGLLALFRRLIRRAHLAPRHS